MSSGTLVPAPAPVGSAVPGAVPRVLLNAPGEELAGLVDQLRQEGLAVLVAPPDGLLGQVEAGGVDLVLLRAPGAEALRDLLRLREASLVPVLVALQDDSAPLDDLLEAGADDCVPPRALPGELAARARALVRRRLRPAAGEVLRSGDFVMDLSRHVFLHRGTVVHLPPKEFGLLALLIGRDGRVVSREEALGRVWGPERTGDPTTVDVHVKRLRAKVEHDPAHPQHLVTVRGMGYRFAV